MHYWISTSKEIFFNKNSLTSDLQYNSDSLSLNSCSLILSSCQDYKPQDPTVNFIEHYRNIYASPENFIKRRVDYGRMKVFDEKFRKEYERRDSFTNLFPSNLNHLINTLAKSGFYYIGTKEDLDKVKCIFCQGTLFSWKKSDIPDKEHRKSFPTCPFILNLNVGNEPLKEESQKYLQIDPDLKNHSGPVPYNVIKTDFMVNFDLPINSNSDCDWREDTFIIHKWPHLQHLALYGLYVQKTSDGDYISCYRCLMSTALISGAENLPIKIFHENSCSFITESFQEHLPRMKSDETAQSKKVNICKIEYSVTDEEIEARLDTRTANKIATVLNQKRNIKLLISQKLKSTGNDYDSIVDLLYDLQMHEEKDDENDHGVDDEDPYAFVMRDHVCVVCLDSPSQVVYLPCGHFKTCRTCSNALKSCPVCRTLIERRVYNIQFHLN